MTGDGPDRVGQALTLVAAVTVAGGVVQGLAAGPVLRALDADDSPSSRQGFATVGMFMVVVGGLQWQALRSQHPSRTVVAWGAAQKFGAATAVAIGVRRGVFGRRALLVAAQDAAAGLLSLTWCVRSQPGS